MEKLSIKEIEMIVRIFEKTSLTEIRITEQNRMITMKKPG